MQWLPFLDGGHGELAGRVLGVKAHRIPHLQILEQGWDRPPETPWSSGHLEVRDGLVLDADLAAGRVDAADDPWVIAISPISFMPSIWLIWPMSWP